MAISDSLTAVRYYTALDPYYYTVDNRPLTDLNTNVETVAEGSQASINAEKAVAIASGFVARGYAQQNYMVGLVSYPGDLTLNVDRAFLNQQYEIDSNDSRVVPHLGLIVDTTNLGPFNAATSSGNEIPYLVQARKIDGDNTTPFYDNTNSFSSDAFYIGNVEFQIKTGPEVSSGSGEGAMPSADSGWVPIFNLIVPYGTNDLSSGNATIKYDHFHEEGAAFGAGSGNAEFEYNIDTRIASQGQQTFTGLTVNAEYAFVFVDGTFQSGSTVNSASSVTLSQPIEEDGTVVDFVTTAGGYYTEGRVRRDIRIAGVGDDTFTNLNVNAYYASVYVNGLYQERFTVNSDNSITLPTTVKKADTVVVFEERTAGIADLGIVVPTGGTTGQALVKDSNQDYDYSWQDVSSGTGVPNGGTTGQVLTKVSNADGDADWEDPTGGGGTGSTFNIETQTASQSQQNFTISREAATALVFVDGTYQGSRSQATGLNQITLDEPVNSGTVLTFVHTGVASSADTVQLNKEADVVTYTNANAIPHPPNVPVNDVIATSGGILLAGSTVSNEMARSPNEGIRWSSNTSSDLPSGIRGLATDNARIVAVGDGGNVAYSDDEGQSWTSVTAVSGVTVLNAVEYDSNNSVWVAVGDGGVIATSSDGTGWSTQVIDSGNIEFKDLYINNSMAVAVGTGGSTSNIWTSTDSSSWTDQTDPTTSGLNKITYGGSRWLAAGEDEILISLNGSTFNVEVDLSTETGATEVFYLDGVYLCFTVGNKVWVSVDDGSSWTPYYVGHGFNSDSIDSSVVINNAVLFMGSYQNGLRVNKVMRGY